MEKSVSVIIPSLNEQNYIKNCLNSLIDNEPDGFLKEIIVVDGFSTDNTKQIVSDYTEKFNYIFLVNNPEKVTPHALNIGIQKATGKYVMIAGAHSSYPANYIKKLVANMETLDADVVGGLMITKVKNDNKKSNSIVKVLSNKFGVGNSMFRLGVKNPTLVDTVPFGLYKRELLLELSGYNTRLIRNQDIELSKRILKKGKKIYLIPNVSCSYYARETFKGIAKNNYKNGLWNLYTTYITKQFSSLSIRHFVPLVFLLSLLLFIAIGFFTKFGFILFFIIFILYNLVLISQILKINNEKTSFVYLLWTFYTLHFSYGVGSFVGLITGVKYFLK